MQVNKTVPVYYFIKIIYIYICAYHQLNGFNNTYFVVDNSLFQVLKLLHPFLKIGLRLQGIYKVSYATTWLFYTIPYKRKDTTLFKWLEIS